MERRYIYKYFYIYIHTVPNRDSYIWPSQLKSIFLFIFFLTSLASSSYDTYVTCALTLYLISVHSIQSNFPPAYLRGVAFINDSKGEVSEPGKDTLNIGGGGNPHLSLAQVVVGWYGLLLHCILIGRNNDELW